MATKGLTEGTPTAAPTPPAVVAAAPATVIAGAANGIVRATKRQGRLRILITGPSGSGKSYTSLVMAAGVVGIEARKDGTPKILAIDSENRSLADYGQNADGSWPVAPFDTIQLAPEYTVAKYLAAHKAAIDGGYEVVIHDSITHAWQGQGGILDQKGRVDARGGNSFANWRAVDPDFNRFRDMLLQSPIHLIATARSKTDYIVDGRGRPQKIGMAPIFRDGIEYEFTVVYDMDLQHQASISKHRTGALYQDRKLFVPTVEHGKELLAWRMSGAAEAPVVVAKVTAAAVANHTAGDELPTDEQKAQIKRLREALKMDLAAAKKAAGLDPLKPVTRDGADTLITYLGALATGDESDDRHEAGEPS